MHNRYLVFINSAYYPYAGMYGCKSKVSTIEEVISFILEHKRQDYDNGRYFDDVQFYDIKEDISYSVDTDVLKESGVVEFTESKIDPYS